jgi:alkanesulfonate monooxygenase SsuD/methylene tetrahydromethanopterin reductase-like flavin-dependent oxidoreductase (luciferase family)
MKFGIQLQTGILTSIKEQAVLADILEYEDVWYPDHLVGGSPSIQWHELFTVLSMIAMNTEHIKISSGVTDVIRRKPEILAQGFASLDQLSNGRAIVGLGAGEKMNFLGFSVKKPIKTLESGIRVMRAAWNTLGVKPVHQIPIYVGGFKPRMMSLIASFADGWLPFSLTPNEYSTIRNLYNFPRNFDFAFMPVTAISTNGSDARTSILKSARKYRVILKDIGLFNWSNTKEEYQKISMLAENVSVEEALSSVLAGNVNEIIERIEYYLPYCNHIIFGIQNPDVLDAIRTLSEVKASF